MSLPSGLFPSGFATKSLYTPLISPIRAICPVHLIHLDLITRIIFSEEYSITFLVTQSPLPYYLVRLRPNHSSSNVYQTSYYWRLLFAIVVLLLSNIFRTGAAIYLIVSVRNILVWATYTFRYFSIDFRYLESVDFKLVVINYPDLCCCYSVNWRPTFLIKCLRMITTFWRSEFNVHGHYAA
jgi:hypothetical protein